MDENYCILLTQYYRVLNSGKSHSSYFSHFNIRCYLHLDESDVKPMLNVWNYERNSERHQICWPSIHSWINTQVCCATVTMFTKLTSKHHWCIHARLKVITILLFESKKTRKTCERWNGRLPRRMRRRKAARCVHAESWKAVSTLNRAFHPTPVSRRSTEECMTADRELAAQVILRSFYLEANTFSDQRTFPGSNDRCMIIPAAWCNRGMFQMTWPRCAWKSVSFKEASARQGESSNCTTGEHVGTRPDRVGGRARERLQSRNLWDRASWVNNRRKLDCLERLQLLVLSVAGKKVKYFRKMRSGHIFSFPWFLVHGKSLDLVIPKSGTIWGWQHQVIYYGPNFSVIQMLPVSQSFPNLAQKLLLLVFFDWIPMFIVLQPEKYTTLQIF